MPVGTVTVISLLVALYVAVDVANWSVPLSLFALPVDLYTKILHIMLLLRSLIALPVESVSCVLVGTVTFIDVLIPFQSKGNITASVSQNVPVRCASAVHGSVRVPGPGDWVLDDATLPRAKLG